MATVEVLSGYDRKTDVTLSYSERSAKTKTELIEEITRLEKQLRAKDDENALLRKRLVIYKSMK